MIVDAHAHLWQPTRRRDDILVLSREPTLAIDAMPDRLLPLLAQHSIDAAVIIQSAPSIDHSNFCLATTNGQDALPAVIGWLDPASDSFEVDLRNASEDDGFAGIRLMLNRMHDPAKVLAHRFVGNLRMLVSHGRATELLALPEHLQLAGQLIDAVGEGRFIVDHAGQPDLRTSDLEDWRDDIRRLAKRPGVSTKVSGLAERIGPNWTAQQLQPIVAFLFAEFSPQRLMFATNWPVCDLVGGVGRWMEGVSEIVDRLGLSPAERAAFYAGTALCAYGLNGSDRLTAAFKSRVRS